jgi:hypothetical protein
MTPKPCDWYPAHIGFLSDHWRCLTHDSKPVRRWGYLRRPKENCTDAK